MPTGVAYVNGRSRTVCGLIQRRDAYFPPTRSVEQPGGEVVRRPIVTVRVWGTLVDVGKSNVTDVVDLGPGRYRPVLRFEPTPLLSRLDGRCQR